MSDEELDVLILDGKEDEGDVFTVCIFTLYPPFDTIYFFSFRFSLILSLSLCVFPYKAGLNVQMN
jgi:hypothetical protein